MLIPWYLYLFSVSSLSDSPEVQFRDSDSAVHTFTADIPVQEYNYFTAGQRHAEAVEGSEVTSAATMVFTSAGKRLANVRDS